MRTTEWPTARTAPFESPLGQGHGRAEEPSEPEAVLFRVFRGEADEFNEFEFVNGSMRVFRGEFDVCNEFEFVLFVADAEPVLFAADAEPVLFVADAEPPG